MTDTQEATPVQQEVTKAGDGQKTNETTDVEMMDNNKEEMQTINSNSTGDCEKNVEDKKKKATQLLLLGRRNIAIHDFQSAVGELAQCCELFKELYGELADEMGDPYFYYGKALLELARQESEVLGEPPQEEGDDDDDEEEEEEAEEEENGDKPGNAGEQSSSVAKTETNNTSNGEVDEKVTEETTAETENDNENDSENEVVNDLQLSWQFLDLAKLIYKRKADNCKETAIKLSEVYLLLGENGLESENYSTAIDDMKEALALQSKVLPTEDRRIAETYYHLGVAHSLEKNFDGAITYFQSAIKQLQVKIASLEERKKIGDKKTEAEEKDAFYTMDGEIENIKSVIKDIEERITDMNDYKNQIKAELQLKLENCQGGVSSSGISGSVIADGGSSSTTSSSSSGAGSSSTVPVTDISHLVRKKRKNENEEDSCSKKPKQENGI